MPIPNGGQPDEDEGTLEGDEVLQSVPEFDVLLLLPVVVNGCEFLFLDDVCKCMGLKEDEALSALAQIAAVEEEPQVSDAPPPHTKLDLMPDPIRQDIQLITGSAMVGTLEESVAHALLAIKGMEEEYSSVPESAFQPHQVLHGSGAHDYGSSININAAHVVEADDQTSNSIQIDAFATRKGGVREHSSGRDSSLWHYLCCFNAQVLRVVHLEYDEDAVGELAVCKALSASLCDEPLAQNANKCVLVSCEAAVYTFAGKFKGHVLSKRALSLTRGVEEHKSIVDTIGQDFVLDDARKEAMRALLRNM